MSCTPQGTTTPVLGLCKPNAGETSWSSAMNSNLDILDGLLSNNFAPGSSIALSVASGVLTITSTASGTLVNNMLTGMNLSNDASTPNTFVDISSGQCADSANVTYISGSSFTKNTTTFVVGSGNGGLAPGLTLAASTWYHVFAAVVSSSYDVFFDTSITATHKPGGTTAFRRIGSIRTNGVSSPNTAVMSFSQNGDYFRWYQSIQDIITGPNTVASTTAITVAPDVKTQAMLCVGVFSTSAEIYTLVTDPAARDEVPSNSLSTLTVASGSNNTAMATVGTDTSSRIRYRSSLQNATVTLSITTLGYYDTRGK